MTAMFTAEERQAALDRVLSLLRDDLRLESVVLVGSMAGTPDRWSDIDLEVAVGHAAPVEEVAADWVRRLYQELPVVHHYEVAFGTTLVRGFLLEDLLELDLSFAPASELSIWQPARLLIDRSGLGQAAIDAPAEWSPTPPDYEGETGYTWHDVLHACTAAMRHRPWQAVFYLQRIRNRALSLASERHGSYADFFDYVDDLPVEERQPLERSLVASFEEDELMNAIGVATRGYLAELHRGAPDLAQRLEPPLLAFLAEAEQIHRDSVR